MLDNKGFDLWADGYDKSVGMSDEDGTYPFAGYKTVFLHYAQLSQSSPEICQKQSIRYSKLLEKLKRAFQNLNEAGLLRDEVFSGEYDNMIDTLYMSIIYWAPFMELKKTAHADNTEYRNYAWNSMYHLLTEKGRSKLQEIIQR